MAAVTATSPTDDDFDRLVRTAQDRLRRAEELARLADDPATAAFAALAAHLDVLAGYHRLEKERVNTRLELVDGRLDEIHDIHTALREVSAATTAAATAEMKEAQAELAGDAARQIAASAAQQLQTLTRTSWLRAVTAVVAVGLVAFVTGGALGLAWGGGSAARTTAAADAAVQWVAAEEGPSAVKDWDILMRSNPIETLMVGCTGANLAVENGRKGCRMWLWIEPPALAAGKAQGLAQ
jgi:hypothetical protein